MKWGYVDLDSNTFTVVRQARSGQFMVFFGGKQLSFYEVVVFVVYYDPVFLWFV